MLANSCCINCEKIKFKKVFYILPQSIVSRGGQKLSLGRVRFFCEKVYKVKKNYYLAAIKNVPGRPEIIIIGTGSFNRERVMERFVYSCGGCWRRLAANRALGRQLSSQASSSGQNSATYCLELVRWGCRPAVLYNAHTCMYIHVCRRTCVKYSSRRSAMNVSD